MRLGTCLPHDESVYKNGEFNIEKSVEELARANITLTMTNFPIEESEWESGSVRLSRALHQAGVSLAEYNPSFTLQPLERSQCRLHAEKLVKKMAIAEQIGCLNLAICTGGYNGYGPHPRNRRHESWELLKETCYIVSEEASKRQLRSRILIEMVYTSVIRTPEELAKLIGEIDSPYIQGHMDIANCLNFDNIYDHSEYIRKAFNTLDGRIGSAHIKDLVPGESYLPCIEQRKPGEGIFDFGTYLECISQLPADTPAMIEHLEKLDDIKQAYEHIRSIARSKKIPLWGES
ncbi:sugar phosphate isomerase/epimerase family protein [Paenibacillus albus]|uniref:Sugar phosphate isomerase/epimerase n=1 Tax=Paenibacillus albus TaxID=2495582 RepID=A0A3S9ABN6_9BACL|nr:sugar phosphate isomerase/epimerase [Paenibacillus albus]AZN43124.1 sugar phosphate isomerase/epimerase [Paenibacillus albus]